MQIKNIKRILSALLILSLTLFLPQTGAFAAAKTFTCFSDFKGVRIGFLTGAAFAGFIDPVIQDVTYKHYNSLSDQAAALSSGEIDAIALDMPVAKYLAAQNADFITFPDMVAKDSYGFAVTKGSPLAEKANAALQKIKDSGMISELEKIWFSADESKKILPALDYKKIYDGSAGIIRYGYENSTAPMSYVGSDGKPLGFDLDIVNRLAYELNMKVEFFPMNFDELLPALASGQIDMAGGSMSVTEKRQKSVDFVGPYYEGGIVLVIKKERMGFPKTGGAPLETAYTVK